MAIALADGAPAAGGILLDPAGIGKALPSFLRRINKPVMLLKADEKVSRARQRGFFYQFIPSGVAEVSISGAAHEDAQFPLEPAPQKSETDHAPTEELQITFVSALTSAAFSLAYTGGFGYAWTSFAGAIENGKLVNAKKK